MILLLSCKSNLSITCILSVSFHHILSNQLQNHGKKTFQKFPFMFNIIKAVKKKEKAPKIKSSMKKEKKTSDRNTTKKKHKDKQIGKKA